MTQPNLNQRVYKRSPTQQKENSNQPIKKKININ